MYHSFDDTDWIYGVFPNELKKQIVYLSKNYTIVPLSMIVEYAQGIRDLENKTFAITVDDGYLDTYSELFPLSKKYGIPFTIFLTTNLAPQEKLGGFERPTIKQIKEMSDSGLVHFEIHGHNHKYFIDCDIPNELSKEIEQCSEAIHQYTGRKPLYAAYPGGKTNEHVIAMLKNYVDAAFSVINGFVQPNQDLFSLKRIGVLKNTTFSLFKLRLTEARDWEEKFRVLFNRK